MATVKTLRLQTFLLLAFIGAVHGTSKAKQPVFDAQQSSSSVTEVTGATACGLALDLSCVSDEASFLAFSKNDAIPTAFTSQAANAALAEQMATGALEVLDKKYSCYAAKDISGSDISVESSKSVTINCTKCGSTANCTNERFMCNAGSGGAANECVCKHGDVSGQTFDENDPTKCQECGGNTDCSKHTIKKKCRSADGACVQCSAVGDCKDQIKIHCNTAGVCVQCLDGADCNDPTPKCNAGTCVQCIVSKDCEKVKDKPNCVSNECSAASPAPTTGSGTDSKGTTTKASVTSSAGTVTSTACLVIASVVVALMI